MTCKKRVLQESKSLELWWLRTRVRVMHYASTSRSDSDVFGKSDHHDDDLATNANKGLLMFAGDNMQI